MLKLAPEISIYNDHDFYAFIFTGDEFVAQVLALKKYCRRSEPDKLIHFD